MRRVLSVAAHGTAHTSPKPTHANPRHRLSGPRWRSQQLGNAGRTDACCPAGPAPQTSPRFRRRTGAGPEHRLGHRTCGSQCRPARTGGTHLNATSNPPPHHHRTDTLRCCNCNGSKGCCRTPGRVCGLVRCPRRLEYTSVKHDWLPRRPCPVRASRTLEQRIRRKPLAGEHPSGRLPRHRSI